MPDKGLLDAVDEMEAKRKQKKVKAATKKEGKDESKDLDLDKVWG